MSYAVVATAPFEQQVDQLERRYRSILDDVDHLIDALAEHPKQGAPLGQGLYKVRLAIASKNRGKSGGAHVITLVYEVREQVFLLAIYDKSEKEDLTPHELAVLRALAEELKR